MKTKEEEEYQLFYLKKLYNYSESKIKKKCKKSDIINKIKGK